MSQETGREVIDDWDMDGAETLGDKSVKFASDLSDAKAVMIYGIMSACLSTLAMSLYIPLRKRRIMNGLKWGMYLHFGMYTPLFLIWIGMSIFDSSMMRDIYKWLVQFSVLGPFGGYWLALIYLFDMASENKFWGDWKLWVTVPVWLSYTVVSQIMQVAIVPKVLHWVDTEPIVEGDGKTYKERKEERQAARDARRNENDNEDDDETVDSDTPTTDF